MTTLAPLSQSQYAEVKPAADPSDAGIEWRHERLKDFIWRARCARLENDPEVIRVVNEMTAMTNELDELAMKQRAPDAPPRPWWCDGEYDETRAEEANDKGMDAFKEKRYEEAFEFYTEAIRLEPRRAGYHANRAACALKLERFRVAAEDADHAIEREKTHVKALVRAGKAYLGLRDPNVASIRFDAALALDPRSVAAAKGKADATRAAGAEAAETAAAAASARKGARAELPPVPAWPSLNPPSCVDGSRARSTCARRCSRTARTGRISARKRCGAAGISTPRSKRLNGARGKRRTRTRRRPGNS